MSDIKTYKIKLIQEKYGYVNVASNSVDQALQYTLNLKGKDADAAITFDNDENFIQIISIDNDDNYDIIKT